MNSRELEAFDRGYRLGKVLPVGWYMAWMPKAEGVIIRAIDPETLQPGDVTARTFKGIEEPLKFQDFIDQILRMAQDTEREVEVEREAAL